MVGLPIEQPGKTAAIWFDERATPALPIGGERVIKPMVRTDT